MRYVGLDVHKRSTSICVLNEHGAPVEQATVRGEWPKLLDWMRRLDAPFSVCYEASCGYGHLFDELSTIADQVTVAHPGHLRLIFRSKRKNDRVDAQKLAKLLYLGEVPTVHVPPGDIRAWRRMIEHRARLVGKRTRTKNGIRALLYGCGSKAPRGLWTQKGRVWLAEVELQSPSDALQRDILLEELDHFDRQIRRVQSHLDGIASGHPGIALLMTIPGVGARTAEAFMAYVADPRRFARSKSIGSYFGLVPSQDSSGPMNRLGHITKSGPATVRGLLTEAAWHSIRRSDRVRCYYERVMHGDPDRRKIALIATAHYLARVMHAMLTTGEVWREATVVDKT